MKTLKFSLTSPPKLRILKNLFLLSFAEFLVFSAYDSLSNLQSTLNNENGIGVASQAIIYAFFTLSAFFLPTYVIRIVGCKTTLVLTIFSICPYIAANIYPNWNTLIPSSILCGLAFGPFWAARGTYINTVSHQYMQFTRGSIDVVNAWFFGISSFFHENAEIWGNVISYFVLRSADTYDFSVNVTNITMEVCGAKFCHDDSASINPNLTPLPMNKRYHLMYIYLLLVVIAGVLLNFFMDSLEENKKKEMEMNTHTTDLIIATFKHLRNKNQLLVLPLTFYCGIADGFYNSDFTRSYIACSWGISHVGYVTIAYGITCAVMDCNSGLLVKYLTRISVFLIAFMAHASVLITCLVWKPNPENQMTFFLLSGIYGIGSSVWWSQITAFYGIVFKTEEEAAFSNFYLWSSFGLLIAYAYSNSICTVVKIYVLITLLIFGIVTYIAAEVRVIKERKMSQAVENQSEFIMFNT